MNDLTGLPVLSIRQPWAWLIANGIKDIENREWYSRFRGRFLIHAGKQAERWDHLEYEDMESMIGRPMPRAINMHKGGIVGEAMMTDCVSASSSAWFCGRYGFVLTKQKELPFVPLKGQLGFFKMPAIETVGTLL